MKLKVIIILFFCLFGLINYSEAANNKIRIAVAPFENLTGYNKYDYLSDLIYNILLSNINDIDDINIYERQRSDLIISERNISLNPIKIAPVDLLIQGSYSFDQSKEKLKIIFYVIDLNNNRTKKLETEIFFSTIKSLIIDIKNFVNSFAVEYKLRLNSENAKTEKNVFGAQIAVIGFNNYSDLKIYDSLQRGIIYFIEERLSQNTKLKILTRENFKEILNEQMLQKTLSGGNAIDLIPADLFIAGCYTFYDNIFRIDCRIIDARTAEIKNIFSMKSDIKKITVSVKNIIDDIYIFLSGIQKRTQLPENIYPANDEALIYYSRGVELFDNGDYLQAIEYIKRAVSIEPDYTFGKWQAAKIYERNLFQYDKAVEAYKQILADTVNKQNYEKALLNLGMIYYNHLKNYKSSIKYFAEFSEKFEHSVYTDIVVYSLGHSYQQLKKYNDALGCYLRFINSNDFSPLLGSFYLRAGQCYYFLDDYKNAKLYITKAVSDYGSEVFKSESQMKNIFIKDEAAKYLLNQK